MKKVTLLVSLVMLMGILFPVQVLCEENQTPSTYRIYVDGTEHAIKGLDVDGQPYLQIQDIAEAFSTSGKTLQLVYEAETKVVSITTDATYRKIKATISPDATLEWNGTPLRAGKAKEQKTCYFSLRDVAEALDVDYEIDEESGTHHIFTYRAFDKNTPSELDRAIAVSIVPQELQGDYDAAITHQEDAALIAQMLAVYTQDDQAALDTWHRVSATFAHSTQTIHRSEGMVQLLFASQIIGLDGMVNDWPLLHQKIGESCWDNLIIDGSLYPNLDKEVTLQNDSPRPIFAAAYFMSFGRSSSVSGKYLFDYDEASNSMRLQYPLTRLEAICAALRLYESGSPWGEGERVVGKQEQEILDAADLKIQEILSSQTDIAVKGKTYYVSNDGDDSNDGRTPETAWKTLEKVNGGVGTVTGAKALKAGDAVLFCRGDIFRGQLIAKKGVTYSAYGEGPKPVITLSPENGAGNEKWTLLSGTQNIWVYHQDITDCGALLLNQSQIAQKTCAYWDGSKYQTLQRDGSLSDFDVRSLEDGWFFNDIDYGGEFSTEKVGKLYFRCDQGNPGALYASIEFFACSHNPWDAGFVTVYDNSTLDNLSFLYGAQGVGGHDANHAIIQNCEVGWMGGMILGFSYEGLGGDNAAAVVRSGDGIMAGGRNITVRNNYIHHTWDHGFTVEAYAQGKKPGNTAANQKTWYRKNIVFDGNVTEDCYGGITIVDWYACGLNVQAPIFTNITVNNNYFMNNGYGWSHLYGNDNEPGFGTVNIGYPKGSKNIVFTDNVFYLTKKGVMGPLINLSPCTPDAQLPAFSGNTYVQNAGQPLVSLTREDGTRRDIFRLQDHIYAVMDAVLSEAHPVFVD